MKMDIDNTEFKMGKFCLALADAAGEDKMDINSKNTPDVAEELEDIISEVCPGYVRKTYAEKKKLDVKELKEEFLKSKKGYEKINHDPNKLIETLADTYNAGDYLSKKQFLTACEKKYGLMHETGKDVKNDFDFLMGCFNIRIREK
jgi:hypothetical protein